MKANLERTTVKDISYLINSSCIRANSGISLEKLAAQLSSSDRYKVYLENGDGQLVGVVQAKQIAMKILELSRQKSDEEDMLPAIAYVLNFHHGHDIAEPPVAVKSTTSLKQILELMELNSIREIAVVDNNYHLIGILEAKNILAHYIQATAEAAL